MPDGSPRVTWIPSNVRVHKVPRRGAQTIVRAAGYPIVITRSAGVDMNSHQAGTVRARLDGNTSVLDPDCRTHDVPHLFVVTSSFFPSLPVMTLP